LEFAYLAVRLFETLQGDEITVNGNITFTDTTNVYALKAATVGISAGVGNNLFWMFQSLVLGQLIP